MKKLIGALLLSISVSLITLSKVNAAIITHGFLTTDDSTNFITDTNTGRMYSRLGQPALQYSALLAELGTGGSWEGWSVATSDISDAFISAAYGLFNTRCTGPVARGTLCQDAFFKVGNGAWTPGDFGIGTVWYYLSTQDTPDRDEFEFGAASIGSLGTIRDSDDFANVDTTDGWVGFGHANYLLYKEAQAVPSPSSLLLLLLGIAAMYSSRNSKTYLF